MERPPRLHYLRGNVGERTPKRLLVIDTEARWESEGRRQLQTLRVWAANLLIRPPQGPGVLSCEHSWGHDREQLADLVAGSARSSPTTWVFTHNLSYDLTLTSLPLELAARGWQLGQNNLASEAPWALLRRGSRSLRLADSWSWLPVSVETLGQLLQLHKPALPEEDDSDDAWLERCRADLEITCAALLRLMEEWDRRQLGWWSLTGPATAWNSMLHMAPQRYHHRSRADTQLPHNHAGPPGAVVPVIDPDPQARSFERNALYSGRRDLWRVGKLPPGPYAQLDLSLAHLSVCAHFPLPDRRGQPFARLELDDWRLSSRLRTLLAECVVTTATPRYPLRHKGAVLHPVGTFQTVLCGPEIREAQARGELVAVGCGYSYRLGWHMQRWARWALELLTEHPPTADPVLLAFLKGASRTVPGRWGMLLSRARRQGDSPHLGWALERARFGMPPAPGYIFHFGGRWTELVRDQEANDSFPAVLGHVQSWVRLLLARLIDRVGEADCLQCNTDGLLVRERRLWALSHEQVPGAGFTERVGLLMNATLEELSRATEPLQVRLKATADRVELLSPQHLRLDGQRLYSGVPASAEEVAPNVFQFWTWPKLAGQIEKGDPRGYVRELRVVNLSALPVNRWAFEDGCCEPVEARWSPSEGTALLPPSAQGCSRHGVALRALQHPALRSLLP